MRIEVVETPIEKGDYLTIWGTNPENKDPVYARVEYLGRTRDRGYRFESLTYGWIWHMNKDKTEIWCEYTPEKRYPVDNSSGWLRYIPQ